MKINRRVFLKHSLLVSILGLNLKQTTAFISEDRNKIKLSKTRWIISREDL